MYEHFNIKSGLTLSQFGPVLDLSSLSAVLVNTTTHSRFYREQHWDPHIIRQAVLILMMC